MPFPIPTQPDSVHAAAEKDTAGRPVVVLTFGFVEDAMVTRQERVAISDPAMLAKIREIADRHMPHIASHGLFVAPDGDGIPTVWRTTDRLTPPEALVQKGTVPAALWEHIIRGLPLLP